MTPVERDMEFAELLESGADEADTPAAPAAMQTYSTGAPAVQLQTLASTGMADGAIAGPVALAVASSKTDPAALSASTAEPAAAGALQQSAAAVLLANATDIDLLDASTEGAGEVAATPASAVPAATTSALVMLPAMAAAVTHAAPEASGATPQPAVAPLEASPAADPATTDKVEAAPASPGGRAPTAQALDQQASAAAGATQAKAIAPLDTATAKPDFAAMLSAQSGQGADAQAQATGATSETARATPTPAVLQAAPAATVQVYNRIIERADGRAQRFEIRLDPAELGRVDVRIEIGADRKVHAVLAAHDSAALSDLMRGQRALERALADAGIDLADNGLRFELARDNGSGSANQQRDSNGRPAQTDVWRRFDTMTMPMTEETAAAVRPSWRPQRLDLVA